MRMAARTKTATLVIALPPPCRVSVGDRPYRERTDAAQATPFLRGHQYPGFVASSSLRPPNSRAARNRQADNVRPSRNGNSGAIAEARKISRLALVVGRRTLVVEICSVVA